MGTTIAGTATALIIIDVQEAFNEPRWGQRNNPEAEANIARLLTVWRRAGRPLFHVRHLNRTPGSSFHPDAPGSRIKAMVRPQDGEPLIEKTVNSSFIGTDLEERLRRGGITAVVITGLTTNHCVETTARMAGNLGFATYFVSDATATFDRVGPDGVHHTAEDIQAMTLSNLNGEFATIVTTDEALRLVQDAVGVR
jgi:nicotinamidase-related amidase